MSEPRGQLRTGELVAVVLAGGFGTRIKHLLPGIPKPMAPVAGRPFLEWVLRYLARQGVRRAVLSTGHLSEVVERHFAQHAIPTMQVQCVVETAPLGTAGGFLHAARQSGAQPPAWLVLNGDSLVFADLGMATAALNDPAVAGAIIGRSVPDATRYGTLAFTPDGDLLRFEEKRPGNGVINSGIYLLRDSTVRQFPGQSPCSFEKDAFPALLARGERIKIVTTEAPFLDIGTPESLPQAEAFIRENRREFAIG